jgi:hypothetical protein
VEIVTAVFGLTVASVDDFSDSALLKMEPSVDPTTDVGSLGTIAGFRPVAAVADFRDGAGGAAGCFPTPT